MTHIILPSFVTLPLVTLSRSGTLLFPKSVYLTNFRTLSSILFFCIAFTALGNKYLCQLHISRETRAPENAFCLSPPARPVARPPMISKQAANNAVLQHDAQPTQHQRSTKNKPQRSHRICIILYYTEWGSRVFILVVELPFYQTGKCKYPTNHRKTELFCNVRKCTRLYGLLLALVV